ncbi:MAG: hypothetical protein PHI34_09490 [Acidobacteriota bacterium]|nr:hypothetical protein [Acidobacteriota bacterium]
MSCPRFDEFELGRMSPQDWALHARECPDCRAEADRDRRLSEEAAMLKTPIQSPDLWNRIEAALRTEAEAGRPKRAGLRPWMIPAAAVALLAVGAAVFLPRTSAPPAPSGLLDQQTLTRVDAQEKQYSKAIDDLEKLARPRISAMDPALMALYRDRLAVIDAQIDKCREALERNPTNAHIRRYFLAALQDKKQTLAEALGS